MEAFNPDAIDVILMDVQMPEMDGFEATREIRKIEARSGSHGHIPIIAMTRLCHRGGPANAAWKPGWMTMSPNPYRPSKLFQAIDALVPPVPEEESSGSAGRAADGQESVSLNADGLIRSFENNHHLFQELVEIFVNDYPQMLNTLRKSLKSTDAETLSRTAHFP